MLLGVISDTHDNLDAVRKASKLFKDKGVEMVLHLGDIIAPFTLKEFKAMGVERLVAVYGNNCGEKLGLRRIAHEVGYEVHEPPLTIEVDGRKILMLHGYGPSETTKTIVYSLAKSGDYDIVLYGHTHQVDVKRIGRTLVLNPGEACGYLTGRRTIAVLDIEKLEAEIIEI